LVWIEFYFLLLLIFLFNAFYREKRKFCRELG